MTSPTSSAVPPPSPIPHPSAPCPFLPALPVPAPAPAAPEATSDSRRWLVYLEHHRAWGWYAVGADQWLPTELNDGQHFTDHERDTHALPAKAEWIEIGSKRYYAVSVAILATEFRGMANTVLELGERGEVAADADLAFGSLLATTIQDLDGVDFDLLIRRVREAVEAAAAKHREGQS